MELFYATGACSLGPHIAMQELGLTYTITKLDLRKGEQKESSFLKVNPKGSVPAIKTDKGEVITEAAVILQYLADQKPDKKLLPPLGTIERVRAQEWLNYISSELHKGFGAYFRLSTYKPETAAEMRAAWGKNLAMRMDFISEQLKKTTYLMGSEFTVPDAYLYTVLRWSNAIEFDLTPWPAILGYMEKMSSRPAVQTALKEEGIQ